jgi:DNA-directed RNA polymerase subunit beta'
LLSEVRLPITVNMLDEVKKLGFLYATRAGISIGIDDMVVPSEKPAGARRRKGRHRRSAQYQEGAITQGERYNKIIEIWSKVTERVSEEMFKSMEEDDRTGRYLNPIYIMADSGARGSKQQIRQLSGMRGLMAKPSGEIIETAHHRQLPRRSGRAAVLHLHARRPQGLGRHRVENGRFRLPHPPPLRRGAGRDRHRDDCGTSDGIYVEPIIESGEIIEPLRDRIVGRVALEDQLDYEGNLIVARESGDHRRSGGGDSGGRYRARQDPLGADLRIEARRLPALLRPQPGHRPHGGTRRSGRHHLRAVHRRAGHAAHHAHLPHRRNGHRIERAIQAGREVDGFVKFIGVTTVKNAKGELIAMNRNGIIASSTTRAAKKNAIRWCTARRFCSPTARGQGQRHPARMGSVHVLDPHRSQRRGPFQGSADGVTMQEQVDEITGRRSGW